MNMQVVSKRPSQTHIPDLSLVRSFLEFEGLYMELSQRGVL
nr:MAG TPA: hypothetical protein [Caudoviricetes sp.]